MITLEKNYYIFFKKKQKNYREKIVLNSRSNVYLKNINSFREHSHCLINCCSGLIKKIVFVSFLTSSPLRLRTDAFRGLK